MADLLAVYLDDHLMGSVVAIELVERTLRLDLPITTRQTLHDLREEIQEDQALLNGLLEERGFSRSRLKTVGAWLAEKAGQLKFAAESDPRLRQVQFLELLALGIQGKMALWTALKGVPGIEAELDLNRMRGRAVDQYARVERERLRAAEAAFLERGESVLRSPEPSRP